MKSFEEYMEHAAHLIDNHYVDGLTTEELAKKIQESDMNNDENLTKE